MDKNLLIFKIRLALAEIINFPHERRHKYDKHHEDPEGELVYLKEDDKLKAVKKNPMAIKHLTDPDEKVQLEAVKSDGYAIKHIKNPSEKVQLEAVKNDGKSIGHIKNPSEKVQFEAIKNDRFSMNFISKPTDDVQLEFVSSSAFKNNQLKWINKPSQVTRDFVKKMESEESRSKAV